VIRAGGELSFVVSKGDRSMRVRLRAVLFAGVASCLVSPGLAQAPILVPPNTNGQPGNWLPAVDHGAHGVGCGGASDTTRFYPIHAHLIPKGPYQGCVLVWESGAQLACRPFPLVPPYAAATDIRWAIFDPRTSPPTIHKFAWTVQLVDAPVPPCDPTNPPGHQGIFCSGHCWLPDGRLIVAGGDYWAASNAPFLCNIGAGFAGSRLLFVFDPSHVDITQPHQTANGPGLGKPWTSLHNQASPVDLHTPRWYPTVTLMAPANMVTNPYVYVSIAGGVVTYDDLSSTIIPVGDTAYNTHELLRWSVSTGAITRDPRLGASSGIAGLFDGPTTPGTGGLSFFYYPRTNFVSARAGSPDGRLWMAGPNAQSADADVINAPETWNNGNTAALGGGSTLIEECVTVMFPATSPAFRDLQVVIGGSHISGSMASHGLIPPTADCWLMPTRATPPNWVGPMAPMWHPRKFANACLLPDASIMVIGGGTNNAHGVPGGGQLEPEMFSGFAWWKLSNQATERTYHSVALTLDDGRVFSAGGDSSHDSAEYEIFEPPYLVGSPTRPRFIVPPPSDIRYGAKFKFKADPGIGRDIEQVVLLRPGSVTHGLDPGQRYELLAHLPVDASGVTVAYAPSDPTTVPPGYCMLFLMSGGVPSVAAWVRLM